MIPQSGYPRSLEDYRMPPPGAGIGAPGGPGPGERESPGRPRSPMRAIPTTITRNRRSKEHPRGRKEPPGRQTGRKSRPAPPRARGDPVGQVKASPADGPLGRRSWPGWGRRMLRDLTRTLNLARHRAARQGLERPGSLPVRLYPRRRSGHCHPSAKPTVFYGIRGVY